MLMHPTADSLILPDRKKMNKRIFEVSTTGVNEKKNPGLPIGEDLVRFQ